MLIIIYSTSNYTLLYGDHSPETNDQQFCHLQFLPISYKTDDADLKFILIDSDVRSLPFTEAWETILKLTCVRTAKTAYLLHYKGG